MVKVLGKLVDEHYRCEHYHSNLDIVALQFKCCKKFYACYFCHQENEKHEVQRWQKEEFENQAILCGNCHKTQSIESYLSGSFRCTHCRAAFNPGCQTHYSYYFEEI